LVHPLWLLDLTLESLGLALSILLVYTYTFGFRGVRGIFTRGLSAISCLLALQSGLSIYFYFHFSQHYGSDLSMPLGAISLVWVIGVGVLFYLSRQ